ncbi:hypothetical protein [Coralloluteibacterium stylophorae]|uniref:Uncharacterized protein n=1 Tax=Coralloluteibacterium stylophorae TaxID=1776034 RepID=A0A8J8B027_9GAMM|nr:hypothetical protein [Coralloluteibacterium stylophorae]MBS7456021.1 hypothetical protein [Coralloluteibacterium stylophorae]
MDSNGYTFGVTLHQIDQLNALVGAIRAQGDVLAVSRGELLEARSLPTLGDAIFDAALSAGKILGEVEAQPLR